MKTYPLTLRNVSSSSESLLVVKASRLIALGGIHAGTFEIFKGTESSLL